MLGFDPTEIFSNHPNVETVVESPLVADPCAHYRVLFLYTEIIESQTVGDVFTPLLRIVNVTGSDGEMVYVRYDRPYYIPLSRKLIDTIEVVIRTHLGELTPFERGRSYVKLHLRQKYLP
ncbi:hypothetical protein AVEN_9196-1 [Araneus ventricosus]|uniref:Uncharacterized protein n=1 Tax=Araneus ventricosus TaxID=182803 RepID=A0A4Y2JRD3_ARAVE|nr:hypothetical protein AVEN_9196-1 [Araneus ventricosus]